MKILSWFLIVVMLWAPMAWAGQNVLDTDAFTNSDGTALTTHAAKWYHTNCGENAFDTVYIKTNGAGADGGGGGYVCNNGFTWTNDQWSELTVITAPDAVFGKWYVLLRAQSNADYSGYACGIDPSGFDDKYRIARYDTGVPAAFLATSSQSIATNDVVNCQIVGNTITLLVNGAAPTGCTSGCVVTDSTYTSGNVGIFIRDGSDVRNADDWRAGSVTAGGGATPRNLMLLGVGP